MRGTMYPPYFLTAYDIACKHGFRGTEEEWLESLRGPRGDPVLWKAQYETEAELRKASPTGKSGECFLVGTHLYWWDEDKDDWTDAGSWQGPQGETGTQGQQGRTGPAGPPGPKGDKGERGDPGPRGCRGPIGPKGEKGDTGPAGPKGDGLHYEDLTPEQVESLRGPAGLEGKQGPQGVQGETGAQGPEGKQGPQGPPGPKGDKGEPGQGLTISGQYDRTEDVPEPEAGKNYYIGAAPPYEVYTYTETGEWVSGGVIRGPAGERGPEGKTGQAGPQGAQGPEGRGVESLVVDDRGQLRAVYSDGTEERLMARGIRYVIRSRFRDSGKPSYGLENEPVRVALEAGNLSGTAEISLLVSGREYDAENMSTDGENSPNGTIILTKMEE